MSVGVKRRWDEVLGRYMELEVVPATANAWEKALPCCSMRRQVQVQFRIAQSWAGWSGRFR